jgi:hypothetical protein
MNDQRNIDRVQDDRNTYSELSESDLTLLRRLLDDQIINKSGINAKRFRAQHDEHLDAISDLVGAGWVEERDGLYFVQLVGVAALSCSHSYAESLVYLCGHIFERLRRAYKVDPERKVLVEELPELVELPMSEVRKALPYLRQASLFGGYSTDLDTPDAYVLLSEDLIRYRGFGDILAQHTEWATRRSRERRAAANGSLRQAAEAEVVNRDASLSKRLPVKERVREVRTAL